jgi:hypothetical protein
VAALERRERSVYRCIREEPEAKPPLEIPKWMFDETVCSRTRAATAGVVSLEDLQQLRLLLRAAVSVPKADGVQGQQGSFFEKGAADAQETPSLPESTTGIVSAACSATGLGDPAEGGPGEGNSGTGSAAKARKRPAPGRCGQGGGR